MRGVPEWDEAQGAGGTGTHEACDVGVPFAVVETKAFARRYPEAGRNARNNRFPSGIAPRNGTAQETGNGTAQGTGGKNNGN